nr:unnamed protein product [Callosobruchus analis]
MKKNAKGKAVAHKRYAEGTGGCPEKIIKLDDVESKITNMIPPIAISGDDVPVPTMEFDFGYVDSSPKTINTDDRKPHPGHDENSVISDKLVKIEEEKKDAMSKYYQAKTDYLLWRQQYEQQKIGLSTQMAQLQVNILEEKKQINPLVSKYIECQIYIYIYIKFLFNGSPLHRKKIDNM